MSANKCQIAEKLARENYQNVLQAIDGERNRKIDEVQKAVEKELGYDKVREKLDAIKQAGALIDSQMSQEIEKVRRKFEDRMKVIQSKVFSLSSENQNLVQKVNDEANRRRQEIENQWRSMRNAASSRLNESLHAIWYEGLDERLKGAVAIVPNLESIQKNGVAGLLATAEGAR